MELRHIVEQFAAAMTAADARRPTAVSPRSGRVYQTGIGPHPEDRAVDLVMLELVKSQPAWRSQLRVCYPEGKQTCDWLLGDPPEWRSNQNTAAERRQRQTGRAAISAYIQPVPAEFIGKRHRHWIER